jgi:Lipocalin-like domain
MNEVQFCTTEIFGVWPLVSLDAIKPNGETTTGWLGENPSGLLVYDASGYISVQIMGSARETAHHDQEKLGSRSHYYAYFGRFEVDKLAKTITHHVQGSLLPEEIGVIYKQNFTLSEDQLTLLTAPHLVAGENRRNLIVWRRVKKFDIQN